MDGKENGGSNVASETCKARMEGIAAQIANVDQHVKQVDEVATKRLDGHAVDIKELSKISTQLATLLESNEARLKVLEDERKAAAEATKSKKPWYESDIGKFVIKAAVIVAILVLAAAMGKGFLADFETVTKVIKP